MKSEGRPGLDLREKRWEALPEWFGQSALPDLLRNFLPSRRWFGSKSRPIRSIMAERIFSLNGGRRGQFFLCLLQVAFLEGENERYFLPLARAKRGEVPEAGLIAPLDPPGDESLWLVDGFFVEEAGRELLRLLLVPEDPPKGLERVWTVVLERRGVAFDPDLVPTVFGGEQSNTSLLFGRRLMFKGYRKLAAGINPDLEVGEFLSRQGEGIPIPATFGALLTKTSRGEPLVLGLLQEFVENQGEGWTWFLTRLPAVLSGEEKGASLDRMVECLGRETARLHRALGGDPSDPDFFPQPFTGEDLAGLCHEIEERIGRVFGSLEKRRPGLPAPARERAEELLSRRSDLEGFLSACRAKGPGGMRIRCHGDFHLGQVLVTKDEGVIFLDFEGEPAVPLALRRLRTTPLQDVAGMLRSFHYLSVSALPDRTTGRERAQGWYREQFGRYIRSYAGELAGLLPGPEQAGGILGLCLLRKALYELAYEIDNRPSWIEIPLSGILSLLEAPLPEFGEPV
ncbi:MAG: phosphotransferase [Leptospirillia bacterium]